jgi:hypothetical protein
MYQSNQRIKTPLTGERITKMFRHCMLVLTGVVASIALIGCNTDAPSGSRLSLGDVSNAEAVTVARAVMSKHFELAPAVPGASEVVALPKPVDARAHRLLGGKSPARQLAQLRVQKQKGLVVANVLVRLQRQGSASLEQFGSTGNYSAIPNGTPAQGSAATTPEQNEAWETRGRDTAMERTILKELYEAMHPGETR